MASDSNINPKLPLEVKPSPVDRDRALRGFRGACGLEDVKNGAQPTHQAELRQPPNLKPAFSWLAMTLAASICALVSSNR